MNTQQKPVNDSTAENHKLAQDLRVALMTQQLSLVFQPKVCIDTAQIVGAEVLLRWDHPTKGLIPADRWVAMAESYDLMRPLTTWLVDQVIHSLKESVSTQGIEGTLPLAINIPPTILDGALALYIIKAITAAGIAPHLLEIEITESAPVTNMTNLANSVHLLKSKGIKIYLDDFGTGYSTMQYLVEVTVDGVKMDKSFVQQAPIIPAAHLVLRSLIELAHEIGLTVVCEGVETQEQLDLVQRLGAQVVQGYLTGKPMTAESFAEQTKVPLTPLFTKTLANKEPGTRAS